MKVIGLTGSIATGKSTAARMLSYLGVPVFDADRAVHALMQHGTPTYDEVVFHFPAAVEDNRIHRGKLGAHIFEDDTARLRLEGILHPKVRAAEILFLKHAIRHRQPVVVLDIPLLFETGTDNLCDTVWVTHCPPFMQEQRAMKRPHMTAAKLKRILERQWPQRGKCELADVILQTGLGKGVTMRMIQQQLQEMQDA